MRPSSFFCALSASARTGVPFCVASLGSLCSVCSSCTGGVDCGDIWGGGEDSVVVDPGWGVWDDGGGGGCGSDVCCSKSGDVAGDGVDMEGGGGCGCGCESVGGGVCREDVGDDTDCISCGYCTDADFGSPPA